MTTSMLHDDNASIFSILPASQGLLCAASYKDLVLESMTEEIGKSTHERSRLVRLKKRLLEVDIHTDKCKIQVDPDKNLLMALAFPDIYTEALALVTGNCVSFELWANQSLSLVKLEQYLFENQQTIPIFTRVALEPTISDNLDEFADVNVILRSNKILQHIGYTINLNSFELEKLHTAEKPEVSESIQETVQEPIGDSPQPANDQQCTEKPQLDTLDTGHVFVDLYHWFCSCDAFDSAITKFVYTADELLNRRQPCTEDETRNVLLNMLRSSPCKHSQSLPICKHILAVVFMVLNWDVCKQFELFGFC